MAPDITKINKYFVIFAFLHGMTYSGEIFFLLFILHTLLELF